MNGVTTKSNIILLLLLAAASCSRHSSVSDTLAHAEAVMEEHPDSALSILQSVPDSALVTDRDRALHALLLSQALDKNYIDITSDSLINIALDYFRDHNDHAHLALTYYYQGRIRVELGDAPSALEHFQKALDVLKEHPDKDLENRIYAQRAHIFHICGMLRNALEENRKALTLCQDLKDTVGIIEISHSLGFEYYTLNDLDSAMIYYRDAFEAAKSLKSDEHQNSILRRMAIISLERNEINQAEELYCRSMPDKSSKPDRSSSHSIGAKIAIARNDSESLKRHLDWLVDSGNLYGKKFALRNLMTYFSNIFTHDSISDMAHRLFVLEDTIQKNDDIHEIANFEYLYNYTTKSKENQRLKIEKERLKFKIVILLGILFVLSCIIIAAIAIFRLRMRLKLSEIENKAKDIVLLSEELRALKDKSGKWEDVINKVYSDKFDKLLVATSEFLDNRESAASMRIYSNNMEKELDRLCDSNFIKSVEKEIDSAKDGMMTELRNSGKFADEEIGLFVLLALNLSPRSIAIITKQNIKTVYTRKRRLKEKLTSSQLPNKDQYLRIFH